MKINNESFDSPCGGCGQPVEKLKRIENGVRYCHECYARFFPKDICIACGELKRIHRNASVKVCRDCKRSHECCARCNKVLCKAARRIGESPLCSSCANLFSNHGACGVCGKIRNNLSRVCSINDSSHKVCQSCYNRQRNITCKHCGKYRPVSAGNDELCRNCDTLGLPSHQCPDCETVVPGIGSSRCRQCDYSQRASRRVKFNLELFEASRLRNAYQSAAFNLIHNHKSGQITHKLDQLAVVFSKFENSGAEIIDEEAIYSVLAGDKTKAKSLHAQLLFKSFGLEWDELNYQNTKEVDRINSIIQRSLDKPFGQIVKEFSDQLLRQKKYKPKTIRVYLACSVSFLESVFPYGEITEKKDEKVASFLLAHPGLRSSLRVFFNFLDTRYQVALEKAKPRKSSDKQLDKALRSNVALLGRKISSSLNISELKSLSAKYISLLYGIPLSSVLNSRVSEFHVAPGSLSWVYNDDIIHIEPAVSDKILKYFFTDATSYLFFGQTRDKPLTESSVFYWTKNLR
jgi:hypothetical protein